MDKELFLAIPTAKPDEKETLIYESVKKLTDYGIVKPDNVSFLKNNENGLAPVYNRILDDERVKGKILVFVHDDVRIDELYLREKLNDSAGSGVVVTALAGSRNLRDDVVRWLILRKMPPMWHVMCKDNSGEVSHFKTDSDFGYNAPCFTSRYGDFGKVEFFDGVFMAIDVDNLPDAVRFDENCKAKFHYYDLNFSLNCLINGVWCETKPIKITHVSHGLKAVTDDFRHGAIYFCDRLKEYLKK